MSEKAFCRIGVLYDGSYFTYAQQFFYHNRRLGWVDFQSFHLLIKNAVRTQEQGYTNYKMGMALRGRGDYDLTGRGRRGRRCGDIGSCQEAAESLVGWLEIRS